jgi:type IX secretion system PorP/SprF family membrane protein
MQRWILISIVILISLKAEAQDPGFSQFFANPLHLNPAFAGTTELPRLVVNYRNQWPSNGTTFSTYSVSYDQLFRKSKTGLGFQLTRDEELNNVLSSNSAQMAYSYHLQLTDFSFMTLGLQAGVTLKQFNPGNLVFPSGINQLSGEISEYVAARYPADKKLFPDFGVGAVGQHNDLFWGASVHHLNTPDESVIEGDRKGKLPAKITLHAGTRMHRLHHGLLSRVFTLSPNILYQQQGSFKQLNLGIYMIEKSFLFGGWYRNNIDIRPDAIIALLGFAKEKFQFGYSFDLTLSELSNYTYGSHEISLTLFLGQKSEVPLRKKLLIPMI